MAASRATPPLLKSLNERTEATVREWLVRWIPVPPPPAPEAVEDLVVTSPLTSAFLGRLTVEPIRSSRLVKVAFDSGHPDLAAHATKWESLDAPC